MTDQTFTLVPSDRLDRMERAIRELADRLEGATVVPGPEWLSVGAAAKALGVSPDTIRRRIEAGIMEARGSGKMRRVRVDQSHKKESNHA